MYAILRQGSRQYKVAPGDTIQIDLVDAEPGSTVKLADVLAVRSGEDFHVGVPTVKGAEVRAKVLRHGKGAKVRVFKFTRRKGFEKRHGHRQQFTELRIEAVSVNGKDLG